MDPKRTRIIAVALFSAGLVAIVMSGSVAAATCTLDAPAAAAIGSPLTISGSGFPASTVVDVSLTVEGGSPDQFTVQSDPTGKFTINLTPEAADAGLTTVAASAGADCAAQVVIAVGVPASAPTAEPSRAVEAAEAAAPRTDTDADPGSAPGGPRMAWLVAGLLLGLGITGLIGARPAPSR